MLRDPLFYALLPGILAPSWVTGVFFHQVHLAEVKGWSLSWFAACYPVYAAATVALSLVAGWAIDRWRAARLLPFYLLPLAAGLAVLGLVDAAAGTVVFMLPNSTVPAISAPTGRSRSPAPCPRAPWARASWAG